jgi:hypothetical protein
MSPSQKSQLLGLGLFLLPAVALAQSQTTVGIGLDYSEGEYGESVTSSTWQIPVTIRHETGPLTLKLNIPYVRASGVTGRDVEIVSDEKETQSGLGDVTASAFYNVYYDSTTRFGLDLGGKIKLPTANDSKTLLTTGKTDYSLQVDAFKGLGGTTVFGTLGWTLKGDPAGTDYRNPWYASLGFSNKLSHATSWGAAYDYRAKLLDGRDPISEASLFLTHKYSEEWKVQGYLVTGFSDNSPDLGGGAVLSRAF